eukprot:CAMPEP_0179033178 /NCGR_PEP_ID=MMETSP0796-20121207/11971_1 /TAXON_ID=73915 /ORGANISM="Pyrodinium bahamense, Strain pbaha01" /LENGTH=223 /DNA_ID=CAMNT_0020729431 /DNA_START=12 /DNA_END=680 /DNA_ORIENTATION=+
MAVEPLARRRSRGRAAPRTSEQVRPASSLREVELGRVWGVVLVPPPLGRRVRHRGLDLRALAPLVERGDRHGIRLQLHGGLPHGVVVASSPAVADVVRVPRADERVIVAGADCGYEQLPARVQLAPDVGPVSRVGPGREPQGGEVGVRSVEAGLLHKPRIAPLADPQAEEEPIEVGATDRIEGRAPSGNVVVRVLDRHVIEPENWQAALLVPPHSRMGSVLLV